MASIWGFKFSKVTHLQHNNRWSYVPEGIFIGSHIIKLSTSNSIHTVNLQEDAEISNHTQGEG